MTASTLGAAIRTARQMKVTDTGVVFCSTNQWTIRCPAKKAQP